MSPDSSTEFYVNFADGKLFGFYYSTLYAQDEIMSTEIPHLANITELATFNSKNDQNLIPYTREDSQPTPVIILNVPRMCSIDVRTPSQSHPKGYYGNSFKNITEVELKKRMKIFS